MDIGPLLDIIDISRGITQGNPYIMPSLFQGKGKCPFLLRIVKLTLFPVVIDLGRRLVKQIIDPGDLDSLPVISKIPVPVSKRPAERAS